MCMNSIASLQLQLRRYKHALNFPKLLPVANITIDLYILSLDVASCAAKFNVAISFNLISAWHAVSSYSNTQNGCSYSSVGQ